MVAMERCQASQRMRIIEPPVKRAATAVRSAQEKARARQRILDTRRRLGESYAQLPNRPICQAMKDFPLRAVGLT